MSSAMAMNPTLHTKHPESFGKLLMAFESNIV